jgi:hypothetical protein
MIALGLDLVKLLSIMNMIKEDFWNCDILYKYIMTSLHFFWKMLWFKKNYWHRHCNRCCLKLFLKFHWCSFIRQRYFSATIARRIPDDWLFIDSQTCWFGVG